MQVFYSFMVDMILIYVYNIIFDNLVITVDRFTFFCVPKEFYFFSFKQKEFFNNV